MIIKSLFRLLFLLILFSHTAFAQEKGILPYTGIKYFKQGIWAKNIDVTLDGKTWTSNRLPIETEFIIKLEKPTGFSKDKEGRFFPGLELLITNKNNDTLGYAPNMFVKNEGIGMDEYSFSNLTLTLGFNKKVNPGDDCIIYMNYLDLKSNNKLQLVFPVKIVSPDQPLDNTNMVYTSKSYTGYNTASTGVALKHPETYLDSLYYPTFLYHSIRLAELEGLTTAEVNAGSYTIWLFDENMNEILPFKAGTHFVAKTKKDVDDMVNILIQVPLDPANKDNKKYTVRYRWENTKTNKMIDVVNRFVN